MNYRKSEAKEAARAQFRGVWAAIPTPFTPDLQVDEAGLRANMRHLTRNLRIEGVFCTGVMGEFWSLTKEERKRIVEVVVEEAKRGGCKVIAHTAHHSAHETVELTRHAQDAGADFVILMNQYYPPATEQTLYEWFRFVADRVDIGLWMFDAEYSGWGMSPELTARIADIPNVCGIKIPRPLEHYAKVQKLVGDRIVMSEPTEGQWLTLMRDYGQKVFQSSPAPYLFQTSGWLPMREYTELGLAGKFDEAERIAKPMQPLREVSAKWLRANWVQRKLIPISYIKAWCELMGMAGGPVRPGLPQITEKERQELRSDLERTGLLARVPTAKAA
jgi:4-hydroxy-tetrahydrodipicolinate synthase